MIPISDLQSIVEQTTLKIKKNIKVENQKAVIKGVIDFHDTYSIACAYRDRVRIHAEVGGFPANLFLQRAPNQTDKEFDYIKGNYKQNTLPVYTDFHSTISRAWSDGNWSISYKEDDAAFKENTLQDYLEKKIELFGSLENYWKSAITHLRNVDPNGVVAVRPESIEGIEDEDGNFIADSSVLPEPQPYYYRCDQVLYRNPKVGYLILTDEKANVIYYDKPMNIGLVMEFYDEKTIYKIKQVGKWTDWQFQIEEFFVHNEGVIPVAELKAIPQLIERNIVYMPEFLYACDNLDLALVNAQYLQVSIANSCFPYRVMVGNSCDFQDKDTETGQILNCESGYISYPDQTRRQCPSCHGSGLKDRVSPMGVLLLSKEDWSGQGDKSFADKAMYYVSPDVDALNFVKVKVLEDLEASRRIMHLHTSTTEVKANSSNTATGQQLDQKAQYAFIKPISDNLFSSFEFTIDRIGFQRYGEKYEKPTVTYPNTFDYNTEQDYLTQLSSAQKSGLPPFIIYTIFHKFLRTLYYYEQETTDVFRLIVSADRILTMPSDEAELKLAKGLVERWEIVLHDSAITFVDELRSENPSLFEMDLKDQVSMLHEKAKAFTDAIVSPSQNIQQSVKDNILSIGG